MIIVETITKTEFTDEKLENLLEDMFNTTFGAGYWCRLMSVNSSTDDETERYTKVLVNRGSWLINEFEEEDEKGKTPVHTVTLDTIKKGLTLLSYQYPHIFDSIVNDQYDGDDCDNMLQMGVFGKLVYC